MATYRSTWLKWLILAALVLALALGVVRALNKKKAQQATAQAAAQALQKDAVFQMAASDAVPIQALTLSQTVNVSGSLKAVQTAAIKAKVAGEVSGLQKREGDTVKAGEVLGRIDSTEAQARVRQAEQQAQAAQAQVTIAQRTQENNQSLVKQGFISATALETSSANLTAAQANHQATLAALDIARKSLGDTTLRAPIAGLVSTRLVQNGERLGIDARIFEVVDLSAFELEAALTPADAASVQVGQTAQLMVEGLTDPVAATVAGINPSVQAGSRSVLIYLRVPAVTGMRQGLFVRGRLVTGQLSGLALPLSSVRNDKPQPYVQVVRNGQVAYVTVPLERQGIVEGEPMLLVDGPATGLAAGEAVLRVQVGSMREGTAVKLGAPGNSAQPAN